MFCTNGVLLRMLTQGDGLDKVTHIVVDEIHERDRFADFLLILLRDILPARPSLRLILMSATLHVEMFSGYFGGCPVITVPGFTYPVQVGSLPLWVWPLSVPMPCRFTVVVPLCHAGMITCVVRLPACMLHKAAGWLGCQVLQGRPSRALPAAAALEAPCHGWQAGLHPSVPGVRLPAALLQDLYLEDILKFIGYTPPDSSSAAPPAAAKQTPAAAAAAKAAAVPPEQRAAVEAAIMAAFLNGDDASFDQLMEATGADMMAQDPASAATNIAHACTGGHTASAGSARLQWWQKSAVAAQQ